jgi:hypothetical protein
MKEGRKHRGLMYAIRSILFALRRRLGLGLRGITTVFLFCRSEKIFSAYP